MRVRSLLVFGLVAVLGGCASGGGGSSGKRVLLAYDDNRPDGVVAFPTMSYESVVRFELPPGNHKQVRLWFQPAGPGTLSLTLYDTSPLDAPGDVLQQVTRVVSTDDVSEGKDGRWLVNELKGVSSSKGVVWVGVKKVGGQPAIWASRVDAGKYYVRSDDPSNPIDLLPVKRTPLVRLELAP